MLECLHTLDRLMDYMDGPHEGTRDRPYWPVISYTREGGGRGFLGIATDTVVCDPCLRNQPLHTTFPTGLQLHSLIHTSFIPLHQVLPTSVHIFSNQGSYFGVHFL